MKRLWLIAAIALFAAAPVLAQTPWIHVEVDEPGDDGTHVNVNLPLSVVQVALEAAPDKIVSEGQIHLDHFDKDLEIDDLRKMWAELRNAGDAEFLTVQDDEETVSVRRDGNFIRIDVSDRGSEKPETVHVEVPVDVVDALFDSDDDELNIEAALSKLRAQRGDIVRVDDGDTKVRVWIDER